MNLPIENVTVGEISKKEQIMMKKLMAVPVLLMTLTMAGCHGHLHHNHPPGHDPDGPGNSENAPGHQ